MTNREATPTGGRSLLKVALLNVALLLLLGFAIRAKPHVESLARVTTKARLIVGTSPNLPTAFLVRNPEEEGPANRHSATFTQRIHRFIASNNGIFPGKQLLAGFMPDDPERAKRDAALQEGLQQALHEAAGVCPKLHLTVEEPLGGAAGGNPMCRAFLGQQRIAIVGNGPLTVAQRGEIETADLVVRFNMMNNWRRMQERLDVWVSRFSPAAGLSYWGFSYMSRHEAQAALDISQAVFLLGGRQKHADALVERWPSLLHERPIALLLPEEPIFMALGKDLGLGDAVPSSGYIGVRIAQHCTGQGAVISLYGFNWSPENWAGHDMDAEKRALEAMAEAGEVVIHTTACEGMRECGAVKFDNSCHWANDHRYKCLLNSDWVDMTWRVSVERRHDAAASSPPSGTTSISQIANAAGSTGGTIVKLTSHGLSDAQTAPHKASNATAAVSQRRSNATTEASLREPDARAAASQGASDAAPAAGGGSAVVLPHREQLALSATLEVWGWRG